MRSTATQTLKSRNLFGYFVLLQLHLYFTFIMKKLSELVLRCRVKDLLLLAGPTAGWVLVDLSEVYEATR